jgi:hypothetical protein
VEDVWVEETGLLTFFDEQLTGDVRVSFCPILMNMGSNDEVMWL